MCSFSSKSIGRFLPGPDAHPVIGSVSIPEEEAEERIEIICEKTAIPNVVEAIKKVHPYEEVAFDVYQLITNEW